MNGKGGVPDAWDDDWEKAADKPEPSRSGPAPKLTKAERRAQHIERQKQLWDSAENPDRLQWLEAQGVVPLKQDFQAPVTLLSRKPVLAKRHPADALDKLSLDDEEDSEEERRKKREADHLERQRKTRIEREEKQKRYAEARERIMGSPNPPSTNSRDNSQGRDNRRQRGGRINGNLRSQPQSPAERSPARPLNGDRTILDPEATVRMSKRETGSAFPKEDHPTRQPRGPENSGRGGFGFVCRGGKLTS